ncbi:hypothetical protein L0244_05710, partial [bacterium]|nr:hypothetical protein [bacterium]
MISTEMRIQLISYAWIFTAVAMIVGCTLNTYGMIKSEYSSMFSGEITLNAIVFAIALGCFFATFKLAKDKVWARRIIKAVSWLFLVYTIIYVLFGGYDDTGWIYALCVIGALILAIFSL